jgi:hypothetical protein
LQTAHPYRGAAVLVSALLASSAFADEGDGGLVGWVESTRGTPVSGAVISIFGHGIRGGSLVTLSDSAGQFVLPSLPAGSYTLRALGAGHVPAPARRITVLPDRDSVYTVSLAPLGDPAASKIDAAKRDGVSGDSDLISEREWHWLLRHRRRSVLEGDGEGPPVPEPVEPALYLAATHAPALPDLGGSVELVTSPTFLGLDPDRFGGDVVPASQGALRLQGRLADTGRWSLGGLVTEAENTTWRMGAEFLLEPGGGHKIETGAGYGTALLRSPQSTEMDPLASRSVGAGFLRDSFAIARDVHATVGTRYTYLGFLDDRNHIDAIFALDLKSTPTTTVHASAGSHTLAPGGDFLTLSTLNSSALTSYAQLDPGLRPSRTWHYELGADRKLGAMRLAARAFYEATDDQLVNLFDRAQGTRYLHIMNGGDLDTRGVGFTVGGHVGEALTGSVSYTYCRSVRAHVPGEPLLSRPGLGFEEADFHDVVARVETFIDWSATRVSAYYRLNTLSPESDPRGHTPTTNRRFDVQLAQGLPFLQSLTRADWQVLLAVRNLFYEASEGAVLDELVVLHPPKRVMGGISVRF